MIRCDNCDAEFTGPVEEARAVGWLVALAPIPGEEAVDYCPNCVLPCVPIVDARIYDEAVGELREQKRDTGHWNT